jgi:hypothetical protein
MNQGWLAYEAFWMLLASRTPRVHRDYRERLRILFRLWFNGFGDKSPLDSFDGND